MNQKGREYLIEEVKKNFNRQVQEINNELIDQPSLNNYLVAAFLDNSIQFADLEQLKVKMRKRVVAMGTNDSLIKTHDVFRRRDYQTKSMMVTLPAEDLFIIPENYKEAYKKYKDVQESVRKRVAVLESQRDTIIMKLNVGSNAALDSLITQVDNLVDLDILNSQFLITEK